MTKSAATTARQIAERRAAAFLRELPNGNTDASAREVVAIVFNVLADPDKFVTEAGRRELGLALPPNSGKDYGRNLAAAMWRTMLAEARR